MMKRSLFFAAALGLLGSLAFTTPSQAANVLVTSQISYAGAIGSPFSTFDYTYAAPIGLVGSVTNVSVTGITPAPAYVSPVITELNSTTIQVVYSSPVFFQSGQFTFISSTLPAGVTNHALTATHGSGSYSTTAVPEPSTMALLGIGMTSFLAFRRFFKRTATA